uniref:Uncharacterized protein n=1 Tax=Timema poppense TaxID=170557 RepID=A0A7R9GUS5_TIMPO|nr:unnamed protein product [Timema poppensis]
MEGRHARMMRVESRGKQHFKKELIMELISEERLSKKSPELTLTWCDLSVYVKRKHDTSFWTRQRFEQIQILNNAPDTIAILPKGGCRCGDRQSAKSIKWLVYLEKTRPDIHIQHAFNGHEIEILGRKVDGYCETTREIFEFDDCFFHGCTCLSNHDVTITGTKETLNERYECTLLRD